MGSWHLWAALGGAGGAAGRGAALLRGGGGCRVGRGRGTAAQQAAGPPKPLPPPRCACYLLPAAHAQECRALLCSLPFLFGQLISKLIKHDKGSNGQRDHSGESRARTSLRHSKLVQCNIWLVEISHAMINDQSNVGDDQSVRTVRSSEVCSFPQNALHTSLLHHTSHNKVSSSDTVPYFVYLQIP